MVLVQAPMAYRLILCATLDAYHLFCLLMTSLTWTGQRDGTFISCCHCSEQQYLFKQALNMGPRHQVVE